MNAKHATTTFDCISLAFFLIVVKLHRMHRIDVAHYYRCHMCVSVLGTRVLCAKKAEPIVSWFVMQTYVGLRNGVLRVE